MSGGYQRPVLAPLRSDQTVLPTRDKGPSHGQRGPALLRTRLLSPNFRNPGGPGGPRKQPASDQRQWGQRPRPTGRQGRALDKGTAASHSAGLLVIKAS